MPFFRTPLCFDEPDRNRPTRCHHLSSETPKRPTLRACLTESCFNTKACSSCPKETNGRNRWKQDTWFDDDDDDAADDNDDDDDDADDDDDDADDDADDEGDDDDDDDDDANDDVDDDDDDADDDDDDADDDDDDDDHDDDDDDDDDDDADDDDDDDAAADDDDDDADDDDSAADDDDAAAADDDDDDDADDDDEDDDDDDDDDDDRLATLNTSYTCIIYRHNVYIYIYKPCAYYMLQIRKLYSKSQTHFRIQRMRPMGSEPTNHFTPCSKTGSHMALHETGIFTYIVFHDLGILHVGEYFLAWIS